jgi:hypothetical protein
MPKLNINYDDHNAPSQPLLLSDLLRRGDNTFVLSARYVVQCALEVFPRVLETRCVLVGLEVGVDELDQAI